MRCIKESKPLQNEILIFTQKIFILIFTHFLHYKQFYSLLFKNIDFFLISQQKIFVEIILFYQSEENNLIEMIVGFNGKEWNWLYFSEYLLTRTIIRYHFST